jgi:hypothetical protein
MRVDPAKLGKKPQDYREHRDENGGDGINVVPVVMNKFFNVEEPYREQTIRGGAVFFICFVCFGGFAVMFCRLLTR